jgi:glycosyltransferase involved in cell wall biosynthesis
MSPESTPVASGEPITSRRSSVGTRRVARAAEGPPRPSAVYVWQSDYPWDVRVEKVTRALKGVGYDTHLVARNERWDVPTEALPEALAHRLRPWTWAGRRIDGALQIPAFFNPRWLGHLSATVQRVRPSVIIVRDVPLAPTAIWVGRWLKVPVILDMAENYPAMLEDVWTVGRQAPWDFVARSPRMASIVEAYSARRVDHVVVVVEENADRIAALGVPRDRITVVSNTPPRARAQLAPPPATKKAGERLEVVYLGILEIPRGLFEAIDAVRILRDRSIAVRLTIVGDGRDASLFHARARDGGLTDDDVRFTGYLPSHEDALAVVAAADVGLIPARTTAQWQTSIPNKLFDYMAAGLAVVTSDTAPCVRVVRETGAGEVFRAGDAAALADALGRLTDPEVRAAAGAAGRRAILTHYNWERDAEILTDAVNGVVRQAAQQQTAIERRP